MRAQVIYKRRKEELAVERERQRKEQEEAENKEAETGKRKQIEEEEAKAQRLTELKSKAESLRQEKSTLFGMLKQALIEEAKKKQKEERAERLRKEEQEKKDKKERALAEAAQALAGANVHAPNHPAMNPMLAGRGQMGAMAPGMGAIGGVGAVPGMPMAYGHQPHGAPFLSPRQGFYGPQDSPRGVAPPQGSGAAGSAGRMQHFSPGQPGQGAAGYGSPQVGVGGVGRSMLTSLQGQNQRFMNMQAYQNQTAMLSRMAGGAMGPAPGMQQTRGSDNRPPPPSAPPPMDGRDPAVPPQQLLPGQPGSQSGARGRGMLYPPAGRGFGGYGYGR